jgi:hypothetical protein
MTTSGSRCDQIIALIDARLAEFESSSDPAAGQPPLTVAGGGV